MKIQKKSQPHVFIPILLIVFGGPAGIAATVLDYLKKGSYNAGKKTDSKKTIVQLAIAGLLIVFLGGALSELAANVIIPGSGAFNDLAPALTQAVLGLVITSRYLHKHNIYFTNKDFWQNQNFAKSLQNLQTGDLKDLLKKDTEAVFASPKPQSTSAAMQTPNSAGIAPNTPYAHSQAQSAIMVDQSGDAWRVKLIALAIVILLGVLAYQYLASNPERLMERVNQVVEKYTQTEKL